MAQWHSRQTLEYSVVLVEFSLDNWFLLFHTTLAVSSGTYRYYRLRGKVCGTKTLSENEHDAICRSGLLVELQEARCWAIYLPVGASRNAGNG